MIRRRAIKRYYVRFIIFIPITLFLLVFLIKQHQQQRNELNIAAIYQQLALTKQQLAPSSFWNGLENEFDLTEIVEMKGPLVLPLPVGAEKKDWTNYAAIDKDGNHQGLGEKGEAAYLKNDTKILEEKLSMENGFNALLSDSISVNRSVPDMRTERCRTKHYLSKLPTVSIVLPFYDEYFSVLLRSIYSIINRTPPELLKEIIIVDDFSDREYLKKDLDKYIVEHFKELVQVVRLTRRTGLIGARLAGARVATADVIIFFDSHIECNYNWLPPLIEPIAINARISTSPAIDSIHHDTFSYIGNYQHRSRGAFDWDFAYKEMPPLPDDTNDETVPFRNPIMMGGLFAISREFFWEIGGYDDGLEIWGGEQFELSLKIWMCGGMLIECPCSHVAHIFRGPMHGRPNPRKFNFVSRNYKRVAEVWLDDYKKYIYQRHPDRYNDQDTGDISLQIALREHLKCKPFQWFLDVVVPDLLKVYPVIEPPNYASGVLQSIAYNEYCVDTMNRPQRNALGLYKCAANHTEPQGNQRFSLSWKNEIRTGSLTDCLDVSTSHKNASVITWSCHNQGGNQYWYYHRQKQWLIHSKMNGNRCLEAFLNGENDGIIYTNDCDEKNVRMRWTFGYINHKAIDQYDEKHETK